MLFQGLAEHFARQSCLHVAKTLDCFIAVFELSFILVLQGGFGELLFNLALFKFDCKTIALACHRLNRFIDRKFLAKVMRSDLCF